MIHVLIYDKKSLRVNRVVTCPETSNLNMLANPDEGIIDKPELVNLFATSRNIPQKILKNQITLIWDNPDLSTSFKKVSLIMTTHGGFADKQLLPKEIGKKTIIVKYRHINSILDDTDRQNLNTLLYLVFDYPHLTQAQQDAIRQYKNIIVPSQFCKDTLIDYGIESRVISHGFDENIYTYKERKYEGKFKIFTSVSSDYFRKGLDQLLSAFIEVTKNNSNIELIVKSSGSNLYEIQNRYKHERIMFINDFYTEEKLVNLMKECHLGVFPFRGEGFGITILETLATGLPCIVTNYGGPRNFITRETCFFLNPRTLNMNGAFYDYEEFKHLLDTAINTPKLLSTMNKNCKELDLKKYYWNNIIHSFRNECQRLIPIMEEVKNPVKIQFVKPVEKLKDNNNNLFYEDFEKAQKKGLKCFIYPPTVEYTFLYQRPHHICDLANQEGYFVIYADRSKHVCEKIKENFWLVPSTFPYTKLEYKERPIFYLTWAYHETIVHDFNINPYIWYDIVDELDLFYHPNGKDKYINQHNYLLKNAHVTSCSADVLFNQFKDNSVDLQLVKNGVYVEHFYKKGDKIKVSRKFDNPVIGFYGALAHWLDWDLIIEVMNKLPEYVFLFVGCEFFADLTKAKKCANFIHIPPVPYKELPNYSRVFDIAWIPFSMDSKIIDACSPLKLYEYLASEHIVVTTPFKESKGLPIFTSDNVDGIVELLKQGVNKKLKPKITQELLHSFSWHTRLKPIWPMLEKLYKGKLDVKKIFKAF